MPQISKYPLDKILEQQMFREFWSSVSKLRDANEVSAFFSDLLSDVEEKMLAKRFTVAVLILRGKRPVDIASAVHVSYSTIASVAAWVTHASPKMRLLLQTIIDQRNWQQILDRIDALLDKLPPAYGTDWHKAGKAKWQRRIERATRQSLR